MSLLILITALSSKTMFVAQPSRELVIKSSFSFAGETKAMTISTNGEQSVPLAVTKLEGLFQPLGDNRCHRASMRYVPPCNKMIDAVKTKTT